MVALRRRGLLLRLRIRQVEWKDFLGPRASGARARSRPVVAARRALACGGTCMRTLATLCPHTSFAPDSDESDADKTQTRHLMNQTWRVHSRGAGPLEPKPPLPPESSPVLILCAPKRAGHWAASGPPRGRQRWGRSTAARSRRLDFCRRTRAHAGGTARRRAFWARGGGAGGEESMFGRGVSASICLSSPAHGPRPQLLRSTRRDLVGAGLRSRVRCGPGGCVSLPKRGTRVTSAPPSGAPESREEEHLPLRVEMLTWPFLMELRRRSYQKVRASNGFCL